MVHGIGPAEARDLIDREQLDVIDVRETGEWASGHLPTARHVSLARLRASPGEALRQDGVLFVCAAGVRSEVAARLALSLGFSKVYNLTGGTRAWSRAGLPLVQDAVSAGTKAA